MSELTGYKGCGENRYIGVENWLEFIITPYCLIEVKPVDAILSNVRMQWTMDEFYAQGGVTSFVDRVSGALGIHASQMKIVAVYKGSVVVDYQLTSDTSSSSSSDAQLRAMKTDLNTLIASDSASDIFGAPVLNSETDGEVIVEDPTYNPASRAQIETQPVTEEQEDTLTISDEGLEINMSEPARNSLIGILVVVVLIVGCCFGCGTITVCLL